MKHFKNIGKKHLFLLLSLILSIATFADSPIDSLERTLFKLEKSHTEEKVDLLIELSWTFRRNNADSTLFFGQKALQLSQNIKYKLGEANALKNIGIAWDIKGQPDSAFLYMNAALAASEALQNDYIIARNLNNLGLAYQRMSSYEVALGYYQRSLDISENTQDPIRGVTLMNIGLLEQKLFNFDEALKYYLRALNISQNSNNSVNTASCFYNIGGIYRKKNNADLALQYYEKAEDLAIKNEDKLLLGKIYNSIGRIYSDIEENEKARQFFQKGLTFSSQIDDQETLINSWLEMGLLDKKRGDFHASIEKAFVGLKTAKELKAKEVIINLYRLLSDNYAAIGNYKKAYEAEQNYIKISNEVFNIEKSNKINALRIQSQISKQEAKVAKLAARQIQNEIIIQKQSSRLSITILGFLVLGFCSLILLRLFRIGKKHNLELEEKVAQRTAALSRTNIDLRNSNEELERFAFITSHDLKEPLRNITGFTKLLERKLGKDLDEEGKTFIEFVQRNTKQMHQLIEDVLQYSKMGKDDDDFQLVNPNKVLTQVRRELKTIISEKNATISHGNLPQLEGNPDNIGLIMKNLIENGIKYNNSPKPSIDIDFKIVNNIVVFAIKDNGIGIAPEYHDQIFLMFKRLHNRQKYVGSGLGLSLVKKLVLRMSGEIWVESKVDVGSTFYFSLPLKQNHTPKEQESPLEMAYQ